MTNNEMVAVLAAFFLEEFKNDALHVAEAMDMSDEEFKQLFDFAEVTAAL